MKKPRIKNPPDRYKPPYPLNQFPADFATRLGREIVYLLISRGSQVRLEGSDWEEIFARLVGADWKPSNVGLDDVVLKQNAWGAKSVKNAAPHAAKKVRLISGRNSPTYSFGESAITSRPPDEVGEEVLEIWNARVDALQSRYRDVRTVVLVKSNNLQELAVFEFKTVRYSPQEYKWRWNARKNLEGRSLDGEHVFTWQPHGSQFTIIEKVPPARLAIKINVPPRIQINKDSLLKSAGFSPSWVEVLPAREE